MLEQRFHIPRYRRSRRWSTTRKSPGSTSWRRTARSPPFQQRLLSERRSARARTGRHPRRTHGVDLFDGRDAHSGPPPGILSAVYLEEFAKNRWTDLIEVNINNLAAVPSVVFGLLGLALFLGVFGMPRSAPLVGGMVLMPMTLPLPSSSRPRCPEGRAALDPAKPLMASAPRQTRWSAITVPLAMPGIMTGRHHRHGAGAGRTAPLLMIGMVAFIVDVPGGITDAATVLPVQIYIWADASERAFVEKTSAGIIVLLFFLILMNAAAIYSGAN